MTHPRRERENNVAPCPLEASCKYSAPLRLDKLESCSASSGQWRGPSFHFNLRIYHYNTNMRGTKATHTSSAAADELGQPIIRAGRVVLLAGNTNKLSRHRLLAIRIRNEPGSEQMKEERLRLSHGDEGRKFCLASGLCACVSVSQLWLACGPDAEDKSLA